MITQLQQANYYSLPGLKGIQAFPKYTRFDAEDIIEQVCIFYDYSRTELVKKRRFKGLVAARQVCCYLIKKHTNLILTDIGEIFDYDHTTVIHSINTVKAFIEIEDPLKGEVEAIEEVLKNRI